MPCTMNRYKYSTGSGKLFDTHYKYANLKRGKESNISVLYHSGANDVEDMLQIENRTRSLQFKRKVLSGK